MAESAPLILKLVSASVSAANRAGQIIRDVLKQGDLGIVDKGLNDLQTEADRSAQRCIVASLTAKFPNLTVIGEEDLHSSEVPQDWIANGPVENILSLKCPVELKNIKEDDVVVWVDPLDGTREYAQGFLENVTVLIGVAVGDKPVGGVVHQPFFTKETSPGRTIWGIEGIGYGGFTPSPPPEGKLILTTTRSHSNPVVEATLEKLKPDEVLKVGGAGYKVLLLLEGKAHAYVFASPGCNRWDTCAPEAILRAVGGKLTDIHGNPYVYSKNTFHKNKTGVLAAATTEIHQLCCKAIPEDALQG